MNSLKMKNEFNVLKPCGMCVGALHRHGHVHTACYGSENLDRVENVPSGQVYQIK